MTTAARLGSHNLTMSLLNAANRGERTPCSDVAYRDHWISESEQQRKQAARWCIEWECPVLTECLTAAIANDERWAVWGGKDFSIRAGKKKAA
jgi:hypothetical protein